MHGLQPPVLGLDRHLAAAGHRHPHGTEVDPVGRGRAPGRRRPRRRDRAWPGRRRSSSPASPRPGPRASPPFERQRADGAGAGLVAGFDQRVATDPFTAAARPPGVAFVRADPPPRPRRAITGAPRQAARARRWSRSHRRRARTRAGPRPRRTGPARRAAPPAARSGRRAAARSSARGSWLIRQTRISPR